MWWTSMDRRCKSKLALFFFLCLCRVVSSIIAQTGVYYQSLKLPSVLALFVFLYFSSTLLDNRPVNDRNKKKDGHKSRIALHSNWISRPFDLGRNKEQNPISYHPPSSCINSFFNMPDNSLIVYFSFFPLRRNWGEVKEIECHENRALGLLVSNPFGADVMCAIVLFCFDFRLWLSSQIEKDGRPHRRARINK